MEELLFSAVIFSESLPLARFLISVPSESGRIRKIGQKTPRMSAVPPSGGNCKIRQMSQYAGLPERGTANFCDLLTFGRSEMSFRFNRRKSELRDSPPLSERHCRRIFPICRHSESTDDDHNTGVGIRGSDINNRLTFREAAINLSIKRCESDIKI